MYGSVVSLIPSGDMLNATAPILMFSVNYPYRYALQCALAFALIEVMLTSFWCFLVSGGDMWNRNCIPIEVTYALWHRVLR